MAAAKDIPELLDDQGNILSSWDAMADMATNFFEGNFGEVPRGGLPGGDPDAIREILHHQTDRLSVEEKEILNSPITLSELGEAAATLANEKCPGPDGTPAEFYKAHWNTVGPLVLESIATGVAAERLPDFMTKGAIVLLPKKSDQRLLSNKRPITLLNTCYKIGAKAMQRRLSPILQRTISYQQAAFLPGRNIHHALLYLSELLHQAHQTGKQYILMKLDVCKAFDKLEWAFILEVVERAGLSGLLSRFLKAGFSTASSHIVLNGRPT